jgi:hypothetical protein
VVKATEITTSTNHFVVTTSDACFVVEATEVTTTTKYHRSCDIKKETLSKDVSFPLLLITAYGFG